MRGGDREILSAEDRAESLRSPAAFAPETGEGRRRNRGLTRG